MTVWTVESRFDRYTSDDKPHEIADRRMIDGNTITDAHVTYLATILEEFGHVTYSVLDIERYS